MAASSIRCEAAFKAALRLLNKATSKISHSPNSCADVVTVN